MFEVNDLRVRLTRGDTALLTLRAAAKRPFTAQDRAVMTVRKPHGAAIAVKTRTLLAVEEKGRTYGEAQFDFPHEETAGFQPGLYEWDVRYALDATLDEQGNVTGGREIITPMRPAEFEVLKAVGEV